MVDNSETFDVYDIKVGMLRKLNDYMEMYMYQRSRSFLDFCPRSLRIGPLVLFLLKRSIHTKLY